MIPKDTVAFKDCSHTFTMITFGPEFRRNSLIFRDRSYLQMLFYKTLIDQQTVVILSSPFTLVGFVEVRYHFDD